METGFDEPFSREHIEELDNWDVAPLRPTLRRCHGEWEDEEHLELLAQAQEAAMMARQHAR